MNISLSKTQQFLQLIVGHNYAVKTFKKIVNERKHKLLDETINDSITGLKLFAFLT